MVAVGWIGDVDNLASVMSGAHTVCHLVGGLDLPDEEAYREANLASVEHAAAAANQSGVRRFLFLSCAGASTSSPNAFLRFKALAEQAVRGSGLEHVIVRATHIYGPGRPPVPPVEGRPDRMWAPVFVQDVVAVLVAADDRERVLSSTWGLEGPDRVRGEELASLRAAAGGPRRLFGRRAVGERRPSPTAADLLDADSVADAPDAAQEFGVARTPLSEGLARSRPE
jgi:uncharacterized protein YbjT (DUF2867 family)